MRTKSVKVLGIALSLLVAVSLAAAQESSDAMAELTKKLQNPLANIKAIMTDNNIGFDTGTDGGTSYGFQFQGVYAVDFPDHGFTMIPRAIIPLVGLQPGTDVPPIGQPVPSRENPLWGLSDSMLQLFFAPHSKSDWKWGIGPQFSFATHTDRDLKGPDWGAGFSGVVTGGITDNLAFSAIAGNHWSYTGKFSTMTIQPVLIYNIPSLPGVSISYNAPISADWKVDKDNRWTVPLGMHVGKTFNMGGGNAFDVSAGPYYNVTRPDGAAKWQLRYGINWLFP